MADAPKKEESKDAPVAEAGWWSWVVFLGTGLVWLIVFVIAFVYLAPIVSQVPAGTWVWRMGVITAICTGGYYSGKMWFDYVRAQAIEKLKWTLLYVKVPRTAPRSVFAMEMVIDSLWDAGGTGTWRHLFWDGAVRKYATLEMVSVEGKIYFFFRVLDGAVDFLKTQIYAQFPEAEISVVDDYVKYVPKYSSSNKDWTLNGFEVQYEKDDEQLYPIKTYVDSGLDRPGKPEERIDPLGNLLEIMAALGPGEQYWVQIHIRAAANKGIKDSVKRQDWQKEYAKNIKKFEEEFQAKIAKETTSTGIDFAKDRITKNMIDFEKDMYEKINRKLAKRAFDVGIRCLYIAKKDMAKGFAHGAVEGALRLFTAPGLNGLKTMNATLFAAHPWDNVMDSGGAKRRQALYDAYVDRSYFYVPHNLGPDKKPRKIMVMSTEEIATLFHFPGEEVTTGGLSRVEARKAEAPANLPIS